MHLFEIYTCEHCNKSRFWTKKNLETKISKISENPENGRYFDIFSSVAHSVSKCYDAQDFAQHKTSHFWTKKNLETKKAKFRKTLKKLPRYPSKEGILKFAAL